MSDAQKKAIDDLMAEKYDCREVDGCGGTMKEWTRVPWAETLHQEDFEWIKEYLSSDECTNYLVTFNDDLLITVWEGAKCFNMIGNQIQE